MDNMGIQRNNMSQLGLGQPNSGARKPQQVGSNGGLMMEAEPQNYDALLNKMKQGQQGSVKGAIMGGMPQQFQPANRTQPAGVPQALGAGAGMLGGMLGGLFGGGGGAQAKQNIFNPQPQQLNNQADGFGRLQGQAGFGSPMANNGSLLRSHHQLNQMPNNGGVTGQGDLTSAILGQPQQAMGAGNSRDIRDQLQWGNVGQMSGFEVGSDYGGDLKARNSMKNTFGRLASQFGSSPDGVRQLVASEQFRQMFPQAKLVDHPTDPKIDFGGMMSDFESGVPVGIVDVLNKSGQGGWQWLDEANDMGMGQQPPMQMAFMPADGLYNDIQNSILGSGQGEQNELLALLEQMQMQQMPQIQQGLGEF